MKTALIIGPGAIGTLLAWHLQNSFCLVVPQHRSDQVLPTRLLDQEQEYPLNWHLSKPDDINPDIDLVLVTTKSSMVRSATSPFLHRFPRATWLICCNGMGPQQWLSEQQPGRVLWASTTEGALQTSSQEVLHTGRGETLIGCAQTELANSDCLQMAHWLTEQSGPLTLRWVDDINTQLWRKLAINAAINPLTAHAGICNGDLLAPHWQAELSAICAEVSAVAAAQGVQLPVNLLAQVREVAERTAHNRSSMLQDMDKGRPTEIEAINGFLLDRGHEQGIATPRLRNWYDAIKKREP